MDILDDLPSGIRPRLIILTGNGRTELRILRALCKRFDGIKALFPLAPFGVKKVGLSVLEIIPSLNKRFNLSFFWALIDSEHIVGDPKTEIMKRIDLRPKKVYEKVFLARSESLTVLVTFLGERNIEDLRAKFIKLKFGVEVPPDKGKIRAFYKARRLTETKEIETASPNVLEAAFKEIICSIKLLETLLS